MSSNSIFMCVVHSTSKPIKPEDEGKIVHHETVHFVDLVPTGLRDQSTYIIDLVDFKLVKDRFNMGQVTETMAHYVTSYYEKVVDAIAAFSQKHPDRDITNLKNFVIECEYAKNKLTPPPPSD